MAYELDHLFVCVSQGAPEGDELVRFGLLEGSPNGHPGQGTANRRFPFLNAMIELIWVDDEREAQSEGTKRTQLWERWSGREKGSCPFGICLRPAGDEQDAVPFPAWEYKPSYLADPLAMHIGEAGGDSGLGEPLWVYLGFMRKEMREGHFRPHANGAREITGLAMTSPAQFPSAAAQVVQSSGILTVRPGKKYELEVELDGGRTGQVKDFGPRLPLAFRY
jgi:hypothetical protein